jgi:hypothetical protein
MLRAIINSLKISTMHFCLRLMVAAISAIQMTSHVFAQDSLRIIELSAPGQSAPVSIPEGHIFTFSLFVPESADLNTEAAIGLVTYPAPISFVYESKITGGFGHTSYDGWYVGPANVALKGAGAGSRMQLYVRKLPKGVAAGVLSHRASSHDVTIPKGSLLTPLLGFSVPISYSGTTPAPDFSNTLSIMDKNGAIFGWTKLDIGWGYYFRLGTPPKRGSANLHNPNAPASQVVRGFYHDDLDSVSPTADFVGPGKATFSLPPENDRSTPIAFYCYRITPANVIGADASPPSVKVTAPANANGATTSNSFVLKGSVTDNINPTSIRFRVRAPNASAHGSWASVRLGGDQRTKNWQRSISLPRKGVWRVQVQALDGENNASTIQKVTLTRR